MPSSWVPLKDSLLVGFAQDFSAKITLLPASYGLLPADATALAALVSSYVTAYNISNDPASRTKPTIATKDVAKAALLLDMRALAKRIQANTSVTPAQKLSLGLPVHDSSPSPIPAPSTKPVLSIVGIVNNDVVIRLVDQTTPTRRARPIGVAGAQVFSYVGTGEAPMDLEQWRFEGLASKAEFTVSFGGADLGKPITIVARWYNAKGEVGPVADAVQTVIAAAPPSIAA